MHVEQPSLHWGKTSLVDHPSLSCGARMLPPSLTQYVSLGNHS